MPYQCTLFLSDLCGRKHKRLDEIKTTHSSKTILLRNIIRNKQKCLMYYKSLSFNKKIKKKKKRKKKEKIITKLQSLSKS